MSYELSKIKCARIKDIVYCETIDSTNLEAKRRATQGADADTLILAGSQNAGRGRLGRVWDNNGDDAIAMTLLLRPSIAPDKVSMITIIAAMAVRDGIKKTCGLSTDIKWPNDLKFHNKKLVGILSESVFCGKDFYTVLGIGINVNNENFPDEIKDIAGSIKLSLNEENDKLIPNIEREQLISSVLDSFYDYYDRLCEDMDLSKIKDEYNKVCITPGVINDNGELVQPDGTIKRSGEV